MLAKIVVHAAPNVSALPVNKDKPKKALEKTTILVAAIPRLNRINFINVSNTVVISF